MERWCICSERKDNNQLKQMNASICWHVSLDIGLTTINLYPSNPEWLWWSPAAEMHAQCLVHERSTKYLTTLTCNLKPNVPLYAGLSKGACATDILLSGKFPGGTINCHRNYEVLASCKTAHQIQTQTQFSMLVLLLRFSNADLWPAFEGIDTRLPSTLTHRVHILYCEF